MIPYKVNGKTHQVASSYQEMKTRHYVRVVKEWEPEKDIADRDYFKLLNILSDSNYVRKDNRVENDITIMDIVGWVITQPVKLDDQLPKALEISGKTILIPRDPAGLSIGQNIHLRRDFIDKASCLEECISIATAIYLQPIIDGAQFSMSRARELAKEVDEMPISITYPIGFFLLRHALTFGLPSASRWSRIKTSLNKMLSRMLPGSRRSTGFSRSTI